MTHLEHKKIAIIGGGPGGLTLARILQMRGVDVRVYERDRHKDARAQGATLDLHEESGLLALKEAGLMDAFRANYRPGAGALHIYDKDACLVWEDDTNAEDAWNRPEIDRGPLQNLLLDALQPGTVVWDSYLVSMSKMQDSWQLDFKNGPSIVADLVIAADGAHSKVRPYITSIKPFFAGITALEGTVYASETACPKVHQMLKGGKIFAMGGNKSLIVSSKGDGSLVFYTGYKTPENWSEDCGVDFSDKAQVVDWFRTTFSGWDPVWFELFKNASYPLIPRPQYCMPPDQRWESLSNLTMIGDAAHLMPPYAGEGVNMAMLDALELGLNLTSTDFADTSAAIESFEKQMLSRASLTAQMTLESTERLHAPNSISFLLEVIGNPSESLELS